MSERIDLGHDHTYTRIVDSAGNWVGINQWHVTPAGEECGGFVRFDTPEALETAPAAAPRWTVVSFDPLHLEPSLLCRGCGDHGFIRDGVWVPA